MKDEPDFNQSKRRIDLYWADALGRLDERIKNMADRMDGVHSKAQAAYEEVFGGPHGQVGLGEQLRGVIKVWGIAAMLIGNSVAAMAWLYDHVFKPSADRPVWGERLQEKWVKEATKRIRIKNPETGQWEYYYMIEERRQ